MEGFKELECDYYDITLSFCSFFPNEKITDANPFITILRWYSHNLSDINFYHFLRIESDKLLIHCRFNKDDLVDDEKIDRITYPQLQKVIKEVARAAFSDDDIIILNFE